MSLVHELYFRISLCECANKDFLLNLLYHNLFQQQCMTLFFVVETVIHSGFRDGLMNGKFKRTDLK